MDSHEAARMNYSYRAAIHYHGEDIESKLVMLVEKIASKLEIKLF